MKYHLVITLFLLFVTLIFNQLFAQEEKDPFMWLEDIDGAKSMEWVKAQNQITVSDLEKYPDFQKIYQKNLEIYNSKDRIAYPEMVGNYIYNFWQDSVNERGLWRRTSFEEYLKPNPVWETVLDFDSLSKAENTLWVYKGANFLYPENNLCMINLSRGGADAVEIREFDLHIKQFIKDGFYLPEAKGSISWIDKNTLFVTTDFGKGSMTNSGYPRIAKIWKRGTPLSEAKTIFEGDTTDISVGAFTVNTAERNYAFVQRGITFFTSYNYAYENENLVKLDFQLDAQFDGIFKNQILLQLKSDWTVGGKTFNQGSLISIDYDKFLKGDKNFTLIDQPGDRESITSVNNSKDFLLVNKLNNVRSELYEFELKDGKWESKKSKCS